MYNSNYGCGPWAGHRRFANAPPVNIEENESCYIINWYAPSLKKENIAVSTGNDILYIRYKEKSEEKRKITVREYQTDSIERSFDLKGKVDIDNIRAAYNNGVLRIDLPKTAQARKPAQDIRID